VTLPAGPDGPHAEAVEIPIGRARLRKFLYLLLDASTPRFIEGLVQQTEVRDYANGIDSMPDALTLERADSVMFRLMGEEK
jgi:hypothetical protein